MAKKKFSPKLLKAKTGGVFTFTLGKSLDENLTKLFEAYCMVNRVTYSEGTRRIIFNYFVEHDLLDDKKLQQYLASAKKAEREYEADVKRFQELGEKIKR